MSFFPLDLAAPAPAPTLAVEWEETACLLCGRRHWSQVVESPDHIPGGTRLWFAVVQCQECGLCFTNPRPTANSIKHFYPGVYGPHQAPERHSNRSRRWGGFRAVRAAGREPAVLPWPPPGRLLDFGCGAGRFLERMSGQGWQVTGLDMAAAVQRVPHDFPIRILEGSLPHPELQAGNFDVITMRHALEHVHDPLGVLREAHRLLVPGGKLLVSVPNIDSLPFRWFGHAWVGLDLPRHLTHFSPGTLQRMLHMAGFALGPLQMLRHRNWLQSSARFSCMARGRPYWHRWLKTRWGAGVTAWYSYLTHQADCLLITAERGPDLH